MPGGAGGGGARLDDRLGDVLGFAEGAGGVDAGAGGLQRLEQRGVAEAVVVQLDAQVAPEVGAPARTISMPTESTTRSKVPRISSFARQV